MKLEFDSVYELLELCRDLTHKDTVLEVNAIQKRLDESEDKVRELQRKLDAYSGADTGAQPDEQLRAKNQEAVLRMLAISYPDALRNILDTMHPNNRIEQIKLVRTLYGCALKEARDFVDNVAPMVFSTKPC